MASLSSLGFVGPLVDSRRDATICAREWRVFPNHSTQSCARSVACCLRPGLGEIWKIRSIKNVNWFPLGRAAAKHRIVYSKRRGPINPAEHVSSTASLLAARDGTPLIDDRETCGRVGNRASGVRRRCTSRLACLQIRSCSASEQQRDWYLSGSQPLPGSPSEWATAPGEGLGCRSTTVLRRSSSS